MRIGSKIVVAAVTLATTLASLRVHAQYYGLDVNSTSATAQGNFVRYYGPPDFGNSAFGTGPQVNLDIYDLDSFGNKYSLYGLDVSTNNLTLAVLLYKTFVSNYTPNQLGYAFWATSGPQPTNTFPPETLITSKIQAPGSSSAFDLISAYNANGNGIYYLNLPNITNAVPGKAYATNWIAFIRKDSSVPQIAGLAVNQNGTVTFKVDNALPGEYLTPQYCTSLAGGNWISNTNHTTYIPVTLSNFGLTVSVAISNLPASNTTAFYRIKVE
jgi:hypothetical protein